LYEETSTGAACYIYGPTGILAKRTTINQESNTYFYHTDHLGSIRLVTDEVKNTVSSITYHPFGEIDIKEGSEDVLFTGKELDSTGLYCHGARYYDPCLGRFITRDSWTYLPNDFRSFGNPVLQWVSNPHVFNRYAYCGNNPLIYTDPTGHGFWSKIGSIVVLATFIALTILCPPVGLAAWAIWAGSAALAVGFFFFECFYEALKVKVIPIPGENDETIGYMWEQDEKMIGGWFCGSKDGGPGYYVWSEEGYYVFVPSDEWEPPPLPEEGEETTPVTIENYPPGWNNPKPEDPEDGSQQSDISNTSSQSDSSYTPPVEPGAGGTSAL
jgi:RHS repeat-associated protein